MIKFPTDFHLGKRLQANTTFTSRMALEQKLFDSAINVSSGNHTTIFCGDLFDSYSNKESVISQGYDMCGYLDFIIAGNHDLKNIEGVTGSLQLLKEMTDVQHEAAIVIADIGKGKVAEETAGDTTIYMVPHHSDQTIFEKSLEKVIDMADESDIANKILCLHCNYNIPKNWDKNETTLALTKDDGQVLLESFDYVLIGHEHNSNTYHNGRLITLGNHHPTGFSDIADKYIWSFDEGEMCKELVWSKDQHYVELAPFQTLVDDQAWKDDAQFIRIIGDLPSEDYPKFTKWMVNLWKAFPNAYAIKNSVDVQRLEIENKVDEEELESLPETISKELKGSPMSPIYEELLLESGE